ncbi:MAG: extracellular solute-binding protein [Anaerolineae bacterium]|nr:extracellular solute-binding protein [Anaerolineae bacterium]
MHARRVIWFALALLALVLGVPGAWAQEEPIVLRVWDQFTDPNEDEGMEMMIAAFEEANPNITIERDVMIFTDMQTVLPTALASGTGPDIFYYGGGAGWLGPLVQAGLVMPLEDAYEAQGWDHIYEWTKRDSRFGDHVYGIGNELEFLGVYYNMDIFEELELEVPMTYEEFTAVCDSLLEAGYIPIAFADGDGWPAYHQFSIFANNLAGKEKIEAALFGEGRWDDPEFVEAIQLFFVDMNQAGYFIPDTTAVSYDDGNAVFWNGMAAMHMTGTWLIGDTMNNTEANIGWFFFPPSTAATCCRPVGWGRCTSCPPRPSIPTRPLPSWTTCLTRSTPKYGWRP